MSTLPPQGSHFEDGVRSGPYFGSQFSNSVNPMTPPAQVATPADTQAPGIYLTPTSLLDIVPTPVSTTLLASGAVTAGAAYVTLTTTSVNGLTVLTSYAGQTTGLNAGPLLQLDSARNISITSTGDISLVNITVYGWDFYGIPIAEQITGPNTTTVFGKKAFYVVQGVRTSAAAANISVGVGNTFGLPFYLKNANYLGIPMWNNGADIGVASNQVSVGPLANNPLTTGAAGSSAVTVTVTSTASLHNGQLVSISGATTTDGITAAELNTTAPITIIDATHFAYNTVGNATAGATVGGGAAVLYAAANLGTSGTLVVADETSPATATTGDVRGTYAPSSNADGTKRLTINMYSASGDTRKFNGAVSGTTILANNPFAINNSTTVTVTAPNHDFTTGENVTFTGATSAHATVFNGTWPVTVIDQNSFTFVSTVTSTGGAQVDGGSAVVMSPAKGNLYQTVISRFGVPQYTPATFP